MLHLYNTATRRKEEFTPLRKGRVGLYSCGPTVYHYAHLGNLRSFLFSDVLRRTFELVGYRVKQVMNITDVGHLVSDADDGEDKMQKGARREGKTAWDVADFYTKAFLDDLSGLNIETPAKLPRATDFIKQQIALVVLLQKKGHTYRIEDGIYFDTTTFTAYASFAGLDVQGQKTGARVNVAGKKHPTDFALWKFSPSGQKRDMEWDSPWGKGFPGWHLECSVMSRELLGQPFDIHTGGADHIAVHHTNEIAQSVAAYGVPLARYWLHNEFLILPSGEKVSKSADNFATLQDIVSRGFDPLAYRLFVLGTHYRKPLTWSEEALRSAQNTMDDLRDRLRDWPKPRLSLLKRGRWRELLKATRGNSPNPSLSRRLTGRDPDFTSGQEGDRFVAALTDDLNTPQALAAFWELTASSRPTPRDSTTVLWMDRVLGLRLKGVLGRPLKVPPDIRKLLAEREAARATKDFKKADAARRKIEEKGFRVEDTPRGPILKSVKRKVKS